MRRKVADSLEQRKNMMIGALWSNSNYDDDKGSRMTAIGEIESGYDEAVERILDRDWEEKKARDDAAYENNPFFRKGRMGVAKIVDPGVGDESTVAEAVERQKMIDQ